MLAASEAEPGCNARLGNSATRNRAVAATVPTLSSAVATVSAAEEPEN